jgi:hypothetical protein
MRIITAVVLLITVFFCGFEGVAKEKKNNAPKVQKFEDVERGFWLKSTIGMALMLGDVFGDDRESPLWPVDPMVGIEMGFDLGQVAAIHLAVYGQHVSGNRTLSASGSEISNDAGALMLMAGGRFALVTTQRLSWFIKASGGYALAVPEMAKLDPGVVVHAGSGIEYATGLRHFFVGLEAAGQYFVASSCFSVLITPTLKYAF